MTRYEYSPGLIVLFCLFMILPFSALAEIDKSEGMSVESKVLGNGGTNGNGSQYSLCATIGQSFTGISNADKNELHSGFWPAFQGEGTNCCDIGGDANSDTQVNVGDAVFLINYVFKGGAPPVCLIQADGNNDCNVNVGDAVYLINYTFKGGPAPVCGCSE
jgi:hypothetical protein